MSPYWCDSVLATMMIYYLSALHHSTPGSSSPTGNESGIMKERLFFFISLVHCKVYFGHRKTFKSLKL